MESIQDELQEALDNAGKRYNIGLATKTEKENQLASLRKGLRFESKTAAKKEVRQLTDKKLALKKAYDDANKAVAAAGATDTVNLVANIKDEIIIDKNVIIDANIYDANGAATGSLYTYS